MAPLISLHHLDDVDPLFPNQTQLDSLRTITEAYKMDPGRIMQQSFGYWKKKWSVSVSWGYAVQIYPQVLTPKELEMPLQTFQTWRSWRNGPFTFNVRPVNPDPCQQPVVFYLDSIEEAKTGGEIVTTYKKFVDKVHNKCRTSAVGIEKVVVSAVKMDHNEWKQVRLFLYFDLPKCVGSNGRDLSHLSMSLGVRTHVYIATSRPMRCI